MKKTILAILGTSLIASGAVAADPYTIYAPDQNSARVSFADLDMASESGLNTLKGRVKTAAGGLCLGNGKEPLRIYTARQACWNQALSSGFSQAEQLHQDSINGVLAMGANTAIVIRVR